MRIGRNLCAGADTWQQALRGGVMLALVFITPLLGWFVVLPLGLASGFGAFLLVAALEVASAADAGDARPTVPPPASPPFPRSRENGLPARIPHHRRERPRAERGDLQERARAGWAICSSMAGMDLQRPLDGPLTPPATPQIDPVAHALNRWTFGPGPGDYARVAALGTDAFLEEQLAPEKIDDSLCDRATARFAECWWEPLGEAYEEDAEYLPPVLRRVAILRAVYSQRQLFEVMCEFWSDHFNIDPGKGDCRYTKIADDQRRRSARTRSAISATCSAPARSARRCSGISTAAPT